VSFDRERTLEVCHFHSVSDVSSAFLLDTPFVAELLKLPAFR